MIGKKQGTNSVYTEGYRERCTSELGNEPEFVLGLLDELLDLAAANLFLDLFPVFFLLTDLEAMLGEGLQCLISSGGVSKVQRGQRGQRGQQGPAKASKVQRQGQQEGDRGIT
ncbi:hypothetical protein FCM35_KLT14556 [Carex littledalei]|uniref:Uncharacterized protein n=1 Tax=Carex littledalei TaxID=544730 RepID=A0A833QDH0_9POAL|nr:hypothetical protein FCM35_KLT14556 [Carex littledalei]